MWYKVYADGTELDIIYANCPEEAIQIAKMRYGLGCDVFWETKPY